MNCQEALNLLYDYIDKEASQIDVKELKAHLANCSDCAEIYRLEGAVQKFIDQKLSWHKTEPLNGLEDLRNKIKAELDRFDRSDTKASPPHPFELAAKTLVAAASLVLLLAIAWYVSGAYQHYRDYHALESAYARVARDPSVLSDPDRTAEVLAYAARELRWNLPSEIGPHRLAGADTISIAGHTSHHFVYLAGQSVVSVFLCEADHLNLPADVRDTPTTVGEVTFYDHACENCRVCFHRHGDIWVIAATTDEAVDLHRFLPGFMAMTLSLF